MDNENIKEILDNLEKVKDGVGTFIGIDNKGAHLLLDYITNLQQENKIKDTNWESLKYYLEKLYYKDYIEEAISDDIDKKIKELESKVEIKGYQKDIKALQQENERLKELDENYPIEEQLEEALKYENIYKTRCEKAIEYNKEIVNNYLEEDDCEYCDGRYATAKHNLNILQNGIKGGNKE